MVFSNSSATLVRKAYPDVTDAVVLRPHRLLTSVPKVEGISPDRRVIGVLGNIGYQKGVAIVSSLAQILETHGAARLVVIGNIEPGYSLSASADLHGAYRVEDIPRLVARYGITDWLIPSIWPETFSFTTHEALATGMPVWCFDLGAQAEAVRAAPNGNVIPLTADSDLAQVVFAYMTRVSPASA